MDKMGQDIIAEFIGTSSLADGCTIKNAWMYKFRFSQKKTIGGFC